MQREIFLNFEKKMKKKILEEGRLKQDQFESLGFLKHFKYQITLPRFALFVVATCIQRGKK